MTNMDQFLFFTPFSINFLMRSSTSLLIMYLKIRWITANSIWKMNSDLLNSEQAKHRSHLLNRNSVEDPVGFEQKIKDNHSDNPIYTSRNVIKKEACENHFSWIFVDIDSGKENTSNSILFGYGSLIIQLILGIMWFVDNIFFECTLFIFQWNTIDLCINDTLDKIQKKIDFYTFLLIFSHSFVVL